jgi:hypothetical protein
LSPRICRLSHRRDVLSVTQTSAVTLHVTGNRIEQVIDRRV